MFLAFVDESGNAGIGASHTYTLGCVIVEAAKWPTTFDDLISFRRFLKQSFGIPVREEIKANYLIHGRGVFRRVTLNERARFKIYRAHMRLHSKLGLQTFAVVIHKASAAIKQPSRDVREIAWEFLLQRLERFTATNVTQVMIIHDEGEAARVRKLARKARRAGSAGMAFGTGSLRRPATQLIDDPVPRDSRQSYFLQLADLTAYAAFRRLYPPPPGVHRPVVPQMMWSELGSAVYSAATALQAGRNPQVVPGIVSWP